MVDNKEIYRVNSSNKNTVCTALENEVNNRYGIRLLLATKDTWESTTLPEKVVVKVKRW